MRYPLRYATGTYGTALDVAVQMKRDAPDAKAAPMASLPVRDLGNRVPVVGLGIKMQRPVAAAPAPPRRGEPTAAQCLLVGNDNFSVVLSRDGGETWGEATRVFTGGPGYVTGLAQLSDGSIVACDQSGQTARSIDGVNWSQDATPIVTDPQHLPFIGGNALCYDNASTLVVPVKDETTGFSYLFTSTTGGSDGSWTQTYGPAQNPFSHTDETNATWVGVAYSGAGFVAVHSNGAVVTSPDGVTWSDAPALTAINFTLDARGYPDADLKQYLCSASGNTGVTQPMVGVSVVPPNTLGDFTKHYLTVSFDAVNWIVSHGGVYVALAAKDPDPLSLWYSTDAVTWTRALTFASGETAMFLRVADGMFFAGITSADLTQSWIVRSADGVTWSDRFEVPGDDTLSNFFEPSLIVVNCPTGEASPCLASGTQAMLDNFTGSSNLPAHTSDSGATWTISSGNTAADTYVVDGTFLRRQDISEGSDGSGESWAYPSQQPATTRFYIEATITFLGQLNGSDPLYSLLAFYQHADAPGNPDFLCSLSSQGLHSDAGLKTGADTLPYTTVPNTPYTMRLFVDGRALTLCINGLLVATATLDADPSGPYGIDTFNFGGVHNFEIDDLTIVDVA